jgi:hypothetical protein
VNFQEVVHSVPAGNADVARQKRFAEDRTDTHKNARLTSKGREQMVRAVVEGGMSKATAARQLYFWIGGPRSACRGFGDSISLP